MFASWLKKMNISWTIVLLALLIYKNLSVRNKAPAERKKTQSINCIRVFENNKVLSTEKLKKNPMSSIPETTQASAVKRATNEITPK